MARRGEADRPADIVALAIFFQPSDRSSHAVDGLALQESDWPGRWWHVRWSLPNRARRRTTVASGLAAAASSAVRCAALGMSSQRIRPSGVVYFLMSSMSDSRSGPRRELQRLGAQQPLRERLDLCPGRYQPRRRPAPTAATRPAALPPSILPKRWNVWTQAWAAGMQANQSAGASSPAVPSSPTAPRRCPARRARTGPPAHGQQTGGRSPAARQDDARRAGRCRAGTAPGPVRPGRPRAEHPRWFARSDAAGCRCGPAAAPAATKRSPSRSSTSPSGPATEPRPSAGTTCQNSRS